MRLSAFLQNQFSDILDTYQSEFRKTFGTTVILAFLFILLSTVLVFESNNESIRFWPSGFTSILWNMESPFFTFRLTDLTWPVFLFFSSIFSIALGRKVMRRQHTENSKEISLIDELQLADFGFPLLALFLSSAAVFLLKYYFNFNTENEPAEQVMVWLYYPIHFLRNYLPLLLAALACGLTLHGRKIQISRQKIFYLVANLWIVYELAFSFFYLVNGMIIKCILIPMPPDSRFIAERMFAIPLVAFLFLAFHSATTNCWPLLQREGTAATGYEDTLPSPLREDIHEEKNIHEP